MALWLHGSYNYYGEPSLTKQKHLPTPLVSLTTSTGRRYRAPPLPSVLSSGVGTRNGLGGQESDVFAVMHGCKAVVRGWEMCPFLREVRSPVHLDIGSMLTYALNFCVIKRPLLANYVGFIRSILGGQCPRPHPGGGGSAATPAV